jgi:hypothetical protein
VVHIVSIGVHDMEFGGHTGKTSGIPPLTGLLPSSFAASLSHRFSLPLFFQLMMVAPYSRISKLSPVGSEAITRPFSLCTDGCGPVVDGEIGAGLFERCAIVVYISLLLCSPVGSVVWYARFRWID